MRPDKVIVALAAKTARVAWVSPAKPGTLCDWRNPDFAYNMSGRLVAHGGRSQNCVFSVRDLLTIVTMSVSKYFLVVCVRKL